jgi:HD-like signal output (HDOD) protein
MKRQICFAGFAESDLATLQPSIAALGGSWECVFATGANSALAELTASSFDAIVANVGSDGISDSELLHEAAVRHPRTLRFVLGDVGDREQMVNCIGAAHQFISRPWKPQELISIVERSLALDAWLANDKLRSFVPRLGKLPGLPSTYFEVLKKAESPHSSISNIAEIIARDPALTARLLQMVNSAASGTTEIITSPGEAVSRLGLDTVKSLVLCLQLFANKRPAVGGSLSLDELWRHSFRVAKLSAKVVERCISSERMMSEAYTAGLLHNIGQIVLATNLSKEYSEVVEAAREQKRPLQDVEMEQLGVTSTHVGAYLLGLWGMPLPLLEAVALHHTPAAGTMVEFSLLTAVHVANAMAQEESGGIKGLPPPQLDADYLGTLELPKTIEAWRKLLASNPWNGSSVESYTEQRRSAPKPAQEKKEWKINKPLVLATVAAIAVAGLAVWLKIAQANHSVTTLAAAEEATPQAKTAGSSAPQAETNAAPAPTAFDAIKLQAILYSAGHPVALINGKTVEVGARINQVKVVSIGRSNVVLAWNGQEKSFGLK